MLTYLPIAELAFSPLLLFGIGAVVGFVAGMFGVGGGFLLTPLLIFSGINPAVVIASQAPQIVASSCSGTLAYAKRSLIDVRLSLFMLIGGFLGVGIGVLLFLLLNQKGQLDLVISVSYLILLGSIGALMLNESLRSLLGIKKQSPKNSKFQAWADSLPFQMTFQKSKVRASAILLLALGFGIGALGTVLGIGGGFILVPVLIYYLRIPTTLAIGTALFQTMLTMVMASMMHATLNKEVDLVLAFILMLGSVIGAQLGAQTGQKLKADQLRALLAVIILAVAARFLLILIVPPEDIFTIIGEIR